MVIISKETPQLIESYRASVTVVSALFNLFQEYTTWTPKEDAFLRKALGVPPQLSPFKYGCQNLNVPGAEDETIIKYKCK